MTYSVQPSDLKPETPPAMGDWYAYARPLAAPRLHLICFHCAGGSAMAYRGWDAFLPGDIALWPVELPGRGRRGRERPLEDVARMADALFEQMRPLLEAPHILFGHSMGAALALEIARRSEAAGLAPARLLAVSARRAPQSAPRAPLSDLSDGALMRRLADLGGTPREVLASEDMMAFLLPIFRADLLANDRYIAPALPLAAPIAAYGGESDAALPPGALSDWAFYTKSRFSTRLFAGGHFYLNDAPAALLEQILEDAR
ncbi:MAG: alpha/beta fold hydrolase [Pseudomonadota bacterium]